MLRSSKRSGISKTDTDFLEFSDPPGLSHVILVHIGSVRPTGDDSYPELQFHISHESNQSNQRREKLKRLF